MIRFAFLSIVSLVVAAGPVPAQRPDLPKKPPATTSPNLTGAPPNPDLTVATVKSQGGLRISKLIGADGMDSAFGRDGDRWSIPEFRRDGDRPA
jgi:hypothetical protein